MPGTLARYRRNVYSQYGEDGVLAEIFRRLALEQPGWFCEFGAWDGKYISNSYHLVRQGWRGVEIEADPEAFALLEETAYEHPGQIVPIHARVAEGGPSSLDAILSRTGLPGDFDLLSIDIDSTDWHVWRSLTFYSPKVVVIEVNSALPPGVERIYVPGEFDPREPPGSSFSSMLRLGREKGYTLVAHTYNMVFVREDLVHRLGLPSRELDAPESLFLDFFINEGRLQRLKRRARWMSRQRLGLKASRMSRRAAAAWKARDRSPARPNIARR